MAITWPAGLPQSPGLGWTEEFGDALVRTPTSTGPAKLRQRFTSAIDRMIWPMALTEAQVGTLDTFYKSTLSNGALAFDITHPRKGTTESVRFVGTPNFANTGGDMYRGNLTFEILP